jgi:AAA+ superfamily predicted ATPase
MAPTPSFLVLMMALAGCVSAHLSKEPRMTDFNSLQPTSLSHLIGNQGVIEQATVALDFAFQDNRRFDHSLLIGPPGMGKSSLASVIAKEMAVPFHEVLGQNLRSPSDLAAQGQSVSRKTVAEAPLTGLSVSIPFADEFPSGAASQPLVPSSHDDAR